MGKHVWIVTSGDEFHGVFNSLNAIKTHFNIVKVWSNSSDVRGGRVDFTCANGQSFNAVFHSVQKHFRA